MLILGHIAMGVLTYKTGRSIEFTLRASTESATGRLPVCRCTLLIQRSIRTGICKMATAFSVYLIEQRAILLGLQILQGIRFRSFGNKRQTTRRLGPTVRTTRSSVECLSLSTR